LTIPTLDATTLKVQASYDGVTFKDIYDGSGVQVLSWASGTFNRCIASRDLADCLGYRYIKLVCGTAQTGAKTCLLSWKP
jgi:hypothetical protein